LRAYLGSRDPFGWIEQFGLKVHPESRVHLGLMVPLGLMVLGLMVHLGLVFSTINFFN